MTKTISWDLKNTLQGQTDKELIDNIISLSEEFTRHKDKLDSYSPKQIFDVIKEEEKIDVLISRVSSYYSLQLSENTQNKEILGKMTSFQQIMTDLSNKTMFFHIWFIHLADEKSKLIINDPLLIDYKHSLNYLSRQKEHTFDEKTEQLLSLSSVVNRSSICDIYEIFTNDFKYSVNGQENITREEATKYVLGKDPKLREEAYKEVLGKFNSNSTILTEMYKFVVIDWNTNATKIRNFSSSISKRNFSNDISDEAVNALLETVQENASTFAEYFKLKHKMNQEPGKEYPFSRFHLYAPFKIHEDKVYSFEESKEIVLNTYKEFDERFYKAAKEIFDENHVHVYPAKAKRSGAFCHSSHRNDIPYILLNHTDDLNSVFTMMHEFGHGIHGMLARVQNDTNYDWAIPVAETASIFGEMLLAHKFLSESKSNDEKKAILTKLLDDEYASIGRQAYFVIFENYAHEAISKGATQDELENKYLENLKEQFGDMEIPDIFKNEWNYIPHIHESPFYCYSYTWGKLFVLSLYRMYQEEGPSFNEKLFNLLSAGESKSPEELMKEIGVDPKDKSFWQKGFSIIKEQIEELKNL